MTGAEWFRTATSASTDWSAAALAGAKADRRISVVIPARDERATVGDIVAGIRRALVETVALVDELVVIDSDSGDDTAAVATDAGAVVHAAATIRPDLGTHRGKGEAIWKSQFVTTGDLLVFVDGDLTLWEPQFVVGLLGPLLTDPGVLLVKGFYDRLLEGRSEARPEGGRVTELVARPLLNLRWPALDHVVQPLAGEWAIRRETLAGLPVPIGYGVEFATLLDVYARFGADAIAQVDLGARAHSHQSVHDLAVMAAEIMAVADRRRGSELIGTELWQFDRGRDPAWRSRPVPLLERPPVATR